MSRKISKRILKQIQRERLSRHTANSRRAVLINWAAAILVPVAVVLGITGVIGDCSRAKREYKAQQATTAPRQVSRRLPIVPVAPLRSYAGTSGPSSRASDIAYKAMPFGNNGIALSPSESDALRWEWGTMTEVVATWDGVVGGWDLYREADGTLRPARPGEESWYVAVMIEFADTRRLDKLSVLRRNRVVSIRE